ncbi:DUF952 domain-containing protein [Pseudooceanicola sediminis]|uniref:DUF952 domain-containing protein n=1 Tax=Pseudooceanicola sediminis TaxID=2211117 RepID=A0A399J2T6_9RHOB|nr:DUF952 domain-containing protein [Pseudooceanicola sediminis]KAA2313958.1 DUF952 domain-containing protein [Puniceibacterium sp. HSS470]RII38769.1 DUF952 domain-containing protein [Pseudooceanicola sediminis]|tara:strand:+ start:87624 stop:87959 length:336 start_codon:yes stop_codon:yes gene_type:complete
MIYKIFTTEQWQQLEAEGTTQGAPIDLSDGFIHFSTADQVAETASKHFAEQDALILAAVDPAPLGDALRWEESRGGALFPHLYAPLRHEDVVNHWPLALSGGRHLFPDGIL